MAARLHREVQGERITARDVPSHPGSCRIVVRGSLALGSQYNPITIRVYGETVHRANMGMAPVMPGPFPCFHGAHGVMMCDPHRGRACAYP